MILAGTPLVIVDIETTGGSYETHRITEIGAIKIIAGQKHSTFHSLIDPERPIPPTITALTGITDEMVRGAPLFGGIADELYHFLDGAVFVAHNARFDYGFIRQEFARLGKKFVSRTLCSARLSRALFPRFKRHNLSAIIERCGITIENRHRALDDASAVWEFLKYVDQHVPPEKQERVAGEILRKPAIPVHLNTQLEDIPESPGVYFFHGESGPPLYIGKAKDLRSRVASHFAGSLSSSKEMTLARQVTRIEWVETCGELAALLLEASFIKQQLPLYNRRSRRTWQLTALKIDTSGEYHRLYLEPYDAIRKEDVADLVTIFRTKGDAARFLEGIAKEYQLCKTLIGLQKNHARAGCFYHEIEQCRGACAGHEKAAVYNTRLMTVIAKHRELRWPFSGPVMIEEKDPSGSRGEVIVVDHWVIQEAFRYDRETRQPLFAVDYLFDLDAFRIIYGYLKKNRKLKIKVLPPQQVPFEHPWSA